MALRDGTRRWLMRLAWSALLVAASVLVGLRIGRPLYYTDGARQLDGRELANASMLQWAAPEAQAEVPGPIAGRVVVLDDGRLLYGRVGGDGTADLVTWQPARPAVPPEPLFSLNTPQNELAPCVTADGRVLFASDRDGGNGGYDLYEAPSLQAGARAVVPLVACNTALDETDPALHGDGSLLVFVRSDRRVDGGNDGCLWRWRRGDALDPVRVFAAPPRSAPRVVDRDPVFAADGTALWFVRKVAGQPLRVQRASRLGEQFAEPLAIGATWSAGELRSPVPLADGRRLGVLQAKPAAGPGADAPALWFVATAYEVLPWWPGQWWLELLLLGVIGTSLLLLVLLHYGRRWSTLDLVAQCLLLSLLLHVLLFLWLMGVEIAGALAPGDDDPSGFEVSVVTASAASASDGGQGGSVVAAEVQFELQQRQLVATVPTTAPAPFAADPASLQAPAVAFAGDVAPSEAGAAPTSPALADASAAMPRRAAHEPSPEVAAVALAAVDASDAARADAVKARADARAADRVEVVAPGSGMVRATPAAAALAPAAGLEAMAVRVPTAVPEPTAPALRELPMVAAADGGSGPLRNGADAAPVAPAADVRTVALTAPVAAAAPSVARSSPPSSTVPQEARVVPRSALARASSPPLSAAAPSLAHASGLPVARAPGTPLAVAMRDAAATPNATATPAPAIPALAAPRPAIAALPAAGTAAAPQATAAPTSRRDVGTQPAPPAAPLARPGSALVRAAAAAPVVASGSSAAIAPSPTRGTAAAPLATLRDAPDHAGPTKADPAKANPAKANPVASATGRTPVVAPIAAANVRSLAPRAAVVERPQRAPLPGLTAAALPPPSPPPSRLVRAATAPVALPSSQPVATASAYSNRFGPAKTVALERFGGNDATERAVQNGLRYLARKQNADGSWGDRRDYDGKYGFVYVGKTALCVLAFLGAGHTPASNSEHSGVVQKAVTHLLGLQEEDSGAFGPSSCYGHGITTYALAECYGLTKDPALLRPLERALQWILDHQGPRRDRRNRGGWGYFAPGLPAEDDYARVSVSSWMIMALESARLSGIELPPEVLPAAREYLQLAYDQPNGWFRYNHKPSRVNSAWPTLPASTPAAAFCLLLLGVPAEDRMIESAVDYTVERRPQRYRRYQDDDFVLRGQGNVYFWYYGTLCCFLRGGEAWTQWNERLRTVLPKAQSTDGSFAPIDVYAEEAGDSDEDRSYTTAMCVLCLEVYYRYFTPLLLGR